MPLFDYECPICSHREEVLESAEGFHINLCTSCLVKCPQYVRYTGGQAATFGGPATIKMNRLISPPVVHQAGYKPGDARHGRGTK